MDEAEAAAVAAAVLGVPPVRVERQVLTHSGNAVYRVHLPAGESVALRASPNPKTFAFTRQNLASLSALGLPVPSVLAAGPTAAGGSYVMLSWMRGRDLIYELDGMGRPQMTRLAEQVVDVQRRVGTLPPAGRFGWAPVGRSPALQTWGEVFGRPAVAEAVRDGTPLGELRARLCTLRARVEPYLGTVRPTPFLDDLTTKNVLVEEGSLSGIIDVDFVCYGDPLLAVGATLACVAGDVGPAGAFYGEELLRCSEPDAAQRLAVLFYATLWAVGFLGQPDAAAGTQRAQSLGGSAEAWLDAAEAN